MRDDELVASQRRSLDAVVRPHLPADRPVALVDFPNFANVGDSAIWLGIRSYLASLGHEPAYVCSQRSYARSELARRIGRGTILLTGGGNVGDLWPHHQELRERVISDFPGNPIVQLPQSIHFGERASLDRARQVFDAHSQLTLLVRDRRSLAVARSEFRATSELCPDMAFALGRVARPGKPTQSVTWLLRTDKEAREDQETGAGSERVDWLDETWTTHGLPTREAVRRRLAYRVGGRIARHPRLLGRGSTLLWRMYEGSAKTRLRYGCALLSTGRIVVTDRLHGHVLCILMGIPHVLLDDRHGKIRSFYDTWTSRCELTRWAESPGEAGQIARAWAVE